MKPSEQVWSIHGIENTCAGNLYTTHGKMQIVLFLSRPLEEK